MKITTRKYEYILRFALLSISVFCLSCNQSCSSSTAPPQCGKITTTALDKTLTVSDPIYNLATQSASSSSSCEAHFYLVFNMANSAKRAKYALGDIPMNLAQAFQVWATDGVGGYFAKDQEWHIRESSPGYWIIDFNDHNSNTTANSVYSIKIPLTSTDPTDSISIQGYIDYHVPQ